MWPGFVNFTNSARIAVLRPEFGSPPTELRSYNDFFLSTHTKQRIYRLMADIVTGFTPFWRNRPRSRFTRPKICGELPHLAVETFSRPKLRGRRFLVKKAPVFPITQFWAKQLKRLEQLTFGAADSASHWGRCIPPPLKPAAGKLKTVARNNFPNKRESAAQLGLVDSLSGFLPLGIYRENRRIQLERMSAPRILPRRFSPHPISAFGAELYARGLITRTNSGCEICNKLTMVG